LSSFALDTALEAVSVVFLLGAFLFSYRLSRLTKGAEIVALAKPKTFFAAILVSFASLFVMELANFENDLFLSIPSFEVVSRLLIVVAALSGVFGLYSAVFYYRTSSKRVALELDQRRRN
jgi:hypothetical protein